MNLSQLTTITTDVLFFFIFIIHALVMCEVERPLTSSSTGQCSWSLHATETGDKHQLDEFLA